MFCKHKTGVVLAAIILLGVAGAGVYMGYHGKLQLGHGQERSEDVVAISEHDTESEEGSRRYRVVSESELSEEDMDAIVYQLQRRADCYSAEAIVLTKRKHAEWYVEISMPHAEESAYEEVIRDVDLKLIGGYGTGNEEIIVTNQNIVSAEASVFGTVAGSNEYVINIAFDEEGARLLAAGTERYIGQQIAIVLDGEVISSPTVQAAITDGKAIITNFDSYEEADHLATVLRSGYLGVEFEEVER